MTVVIIFDPILEEDPSLSEVYYFLVQEVLNFILQYFSLSVEYGLDRETPFF